MDINLLIRVQEIEKELEYLKSIKCNLYYKIYIKELKFELKLLKDKIKEECNNDGHYFEIINLNDKKCKQKCKICGFVQKKNLRNNIF